MSVTNGVTFPLEDAIRATCGRGRSRQTLAGDNVAGQWGWVSPFLLAPKAPFSSARSPAYLGLTCLPGAQACVLGRDFLLCGHVGQLKGSLVLPCKPHPHFLQAQVGYGLPRKKHF